MLSKTRVLLVVNNERGSFTAILGGENNKMAHLIENLIGRSREVCSLTQTPTVDRYTAPSQNPLCMDVWEGVIKIIKIIGSVSA